jgi:hypothetical protein
LIACSKKEKDGISIDFIQFTKELGRALEFQSIPNSNALKLKDNTIIDLDNKLEYTIDIYCAKEVKRVKSRYIAGRNGTKEEKTSTTEFEYDYNVYKKNIGDNIKTLKGIEKCNEDGFLSIYEKLIGIFKSDNKISEYRGIVVGDKIVYELDNDVYICDLRKYSKSDIIGHKCSIIDRHMSSVYLNRNRRISGVTESTIYKFDTDDNSMELCRIDYS